MTAQFSLQQNEDYRDNDLGFLPDNWVIKSLGEINIEKAKNILPLNGEIYEYYSIPAYQELKKPAIVDGKTILSQKKILKEGTVLFGKLNPRVEKVWQVKSYSSHEKIGSGEWITILPNLTQINSDYIYYLQWSNYVMPIAKALISGSTPSRQRVDQSSFYNIKVPIPPLPEQRNISIVLSTIQEAKEKAENSIRSIIQFKKSLMKHLFTYGAVSLAEAGKVKLKNIDIGSISQNWEIKKICDLFEISKKPRDLKILQNEKIVFIGMTKISANYEETQYEIKQYSTIASGVYVQKGDLIIAKITLCLENGKQALLNNIPKDFAIATTEVIPLHPKDEKVIIEYLYHYLKLPQARQKLISKMEGTTGRKRLSKTVMENFVIPLPSVIEQKQITSMLSSVDKKIKTEERRKEALDELFKSMLFNLMSAKIRVNNLEA